MMEHLVTIMDCERYIYPFKKEIRGSCAISNATANYGERASIPANSRNHTSQVAANSRLEAHKE